eukprot:2498576-Prymnesium_polylepis.1
MGDGVETVWKWGEDGVQTGRRRVVDTGRRQGGDGAETGRLAGMWRRSGTWRQRNGNAWQRRRR